MNWIIGIGLAVIVIMVIIINSNLIILNKNFIKFHDNFINYVKGIIEFLNKTLQKYGRIELDYGDPGVQVAAPSLIAAHVKFIQRYRLLEENDDIETMEALDMSKYEEYGLVMLEVWVKRSFLEKVVDEVLKGEDSDVQDNILDYVPPIICADADIYGAVGADGSYAFIADYNSEIMKIDLEDDDNDID